jgi:endonuclease/exonuclease/phosphatase family metal-dependent hydrolase
VTTFRRLNACAKINPASSPKREPLAEAVRVRVVTLNLLHAAPIPGRRHARTSLDTRLAWTSEQLAEARPDVVLLQEASAGVRQENTAAVLARSLGMKAVYARANPSPFFRLAGAGRILFEEGPAVLSRFPIVAHRVHRLSSRLNLFERRLALEAVLQGPAGRFKVFSVHLSARSAVDRRRQIAQLIRQVEVTPHAHPMIVGGDFNAEEHSHEIRLLTEVKGWIDSFRHLNRDVAGHTWGQALTSAEATAASRIDFLFSVPSPDERWEPYHSRLILDRSFPESRGGVLWASDHYGVLSDFEAPRSERNSSE